MPTTSASRVLDELSTRIGMTKIVPPWRLSSFVLTPKRGRVSPPATPRHA
jgi:hypothetical protein